MSLEGKAAGKRLKGRINSVDTLILSAYAIAVKNGFEGTEEEWLASLKGEKGDKGDKGDFEYSEEIALIAKDPNNDGNVILTYGGVIGGDPVPGLTEAEVQAMIDASLGVIANGTY